MSRQDDLQRLIANHQRRLQKLKEQRASFGLHTPPYILIDIENTEAELAKLQDELAALGHPALGEAAPAPPPTAPQVFISYSRRDIGFVHRLAADLERAGFATWWDVSKLVGGEVWTQTIEAALEQSQCCLVVLSPNSVKAAWVRKEYLYAKDLKLKIISILYQPCRIPLALADLQYIDFQGNDYQAGLRQLLACLSLGLVLSPVGGVREGQGVDLKEKLLARGPLLGRIIVAVVAIIALALTFYTFYTDFSVVPLLNTPIHVATTIGIGTTTTSVSPTNTPVPPTATPVSPTYTPTSLPPTATPTLTNLPTLITDDYGVPMVLVSAGSFEMGSDADVVLVECQKLYSGDCQRGWFEDEEPIHTITLDDFYIDRYEVTNGRYATCVDAGACVPPAGFGSYTRNSYYGHPEYDDYPVIYVTWEQAKSYCEWRGARLPTEAEWEKAARGTDGRMYPWGENIDCNLANYWGRDDGCVGDATAVGTYPAGVSPYQIYDMAGNVWEWVADWYALDYYQTSPSVNPTGPPSGESRVVRGGAWINNGSIVHTAYRHQNKPSVPGYNIGFRCARSP